MQHDAVHDHDGDVDQIVPLHTGVELEVEHEHLEIDVGEHDESEVTEEDDPPEDWLSEDFHRVKQKANN